MIICFFILVFRRVVSQKTLEYFVEWRLIVLWKKIESFHHNTIHRSIVTQDEVVDFFFYFWFFPPQGCFIILNCDILKMEIS